MDNNIRNNRIKVDNIPILEIIIVLMYVLSAYKIGPLNLATLILLIYSGVFIIRRRRVTMYVPVLLLFSYMLVHDIVKSFIANVNIFNWTEKIIFFVFFATIIGNINKEKLYKIWKVVGIIAMLGLFVQAVQVYLLGQSVGMIKILPFASDEAMNTTVEYMRPHSFFLEPAAYATWILPLLIMALQKKKTVFAIFITLSILLSSSVSGILAAGIIWIYYSAVGFSLYETRRNALIMISLLIVGGMAFLSLNVFSTSLDKLSNTTTDDKSTSSRTTLGLELYRDIGPVEKLVGIPFENVEEYMKSGAIDIKKYNMTYKLSYLGFVNSIGLSLNMYGFIGTLLYIAMFYKFYRATSKGKRAYIIICFISLFSQSAFWNSLFLLQVSFMIANSDVKEDLLIIGRREVIESDN